MLFGSFYFKMSERDIEINEEAINKLTEAEVLALHAQIAERVKKPLETATALNNNLLIENLYLKKQNLEIHTQESLENAQRRRRTNTEEYLTIMKLSGAIDKKLMEAAKKKKPIPDESETKIQLIQNEASKIIQKRKEITELLLNSFGTIRVFARVKPDVTPKKKDDKYMHYLKLTEKTIEPILALQKPILLDEKGEPMKLGEKGKVVEMEQKEFEKTLEYIQFEKLGIKKFIKDPPMSFEDVFYPEKTIKEMYDILEEKKIANIEFDSQKPKNSVFFAFGRTNTGKTYNLEGKDLKGEEKGKGLYYYIVSHMLAKIDLKNASDTKQKYTLKYSVIENNPFTFYKETKTSTKDEGVKYIATDTPLNCYFRDLLNVNAKSAGYVVEKVDRKNKSTANGMYELYFQDGKITRPENVFSEKFTTPKINTLEQFKETMLSVAERRTYNETKENASSSRSHLIIQLIVFNETTNRVHSVHSMIDLAGFEGTDSENKIIRDQSVAIATSLRTIGRLVDVYSDNTSRSVKARMVFQDLPYPSIYSSYLAQFLYPVLHKGDGNPPSRITFLWCVNPSFLYSQPASDVENARRLTLQCMEMVKSFSKQKDESSVDGEQLTNDIKNRLVSIQQIITKYTDSSIRDPITLPINARNVLLEQWFETDPESKEKIPTTFEELNRCQKKANDVTSLCESVLISEARGQKAAVSVRGFLDAQEADELNEITLQSAKGIAVFWMKRELLQNLRNPNTQILKSWYNKDNGYVPKDLLAEHNIQQTITPFTEQELTRLIPLLNIRLYDAIERQRFTDTQAEVVWNFFGFITESLYHIQLEKYESIALILIDRANVFNNAYERLYHFVYISSENNKKKILEHEKNQEKLTPQEIKQQEIMISGELRFVECKKILNALKEEKKGLEKFTFQSDLEKIQTLFFDIQKEIGKTTYDKISRFTPQDAISTAYLIKAVEAEEIKKQIGSLNVDLKFTNKKTIDENNTRNALNQNNVDLQKKVVVFSNQLTEKEKEIETLVEGFSNEEKRLLSVMEEKNKELLQKQDVIDNLLKSLLNEKNNEKVNPGRMHDYEDVDEKGRDLSSDDEDEDEKDPEKPLDHIKKLNEEDRQDLIDALNRKVGIPFVFIPEEGLQMMNYDYGTDPFVKVPTSSILATGLDPILFDELVDLKSLNDELKAFSNGAFIKDLTNEAQKIIKSVEDELKKQRKQKGKKIIYNPLMQLVNISWTTFLQGNI